MGSGFDLNSQTGVMALLYAVRQSGLSAAEKSAVRDLVFQYSNGGGDATVRRALEQKIAAHSLAPVPFGAKEKNAPRGGEPASLVAPSAPRPFGNQRPAPRFAPVSTQKKAPEKVEVKAAPAVSAPVPPSAVPRAQVVPEAAPQSATPPAEVVPQPVAPPTDAFAESASAALARIQAIKHAVNEKVGNPVNLVDINNVVGREYMVALLEAMKKAGGGVSGELSSAMVRLEAAYAAVEEVLQSQPAPAVQATPTPITAPVVPPSAPRVAEIPVRASAPMSAPAPTPEPLPPRPVVPTPPTPQSSTRAAPVSERPARPSEPTSFRAVPLSQDGGRLLTPQDLPDASSLETSSVTGDPLFTDQVDNGLDQLLSEWSIFKKSGLFGTGPKGREHPLFAALAPLTIPLILAGRYDGASPETRQSITDYMNGWRYEQGIVHEPEETFEHYLRRVIKHILDLQNRRRQA